MPDFQMNLDSSEWELFHRFGIKISLRAIKRSSMLGLQNTPGGQYAVSAGHCD
jgi:hypothetical protein